MTGPFPIIANAPALGGAYPAQPAPAPPPQDAAHVGEPGAGATSSPAVGGVLPGERRSTVDGRR